MTKRNLFRIAVAALLLGYFAYTYMRPKPGGPATAQRTLLPAVPTNAPRFTVGKLEFTRCELTQKRSGATTAAYCAPLQVPENYAAPDGRRIDLHLALLKADAEAADADFVVFLAGGPGQAAIENWPAVASAFAPLRKHHHVVLLDQRGTGGSNALTCERSADDDDKDRDKPADAPVDLAANLDAVRRATRVP